MVLIRRLVDNPTMEHLSTRKLGRSLMRITSLASSYHGRVCRGSFPPSPCSSPDLESRWRCPSPSDSHIYTYQFVECQLYTEVSCTSLNLHILIPGLSPHTRMPADGPYALTLISRVTVSLTGPIGGYNVLTTWFRCRTVVESPARYYTVSPLKYL